MDASLNVRRPPAAAPNEVEVGGCQTGYPSMRNDFLYAIMSRYFHLSISYVLRSLLVRVQGIQICHVLVEVGEPTPLAPFESMHVPRYTQQRQSGEYLSKDPF